MVGFYICTVAALISVLLAAGWGIFCLFFKRFNERKWWNTALIVFSTGAIVAGGFLYIGYYTLLSTAATENVSGVIVKWYESIGTIIHDTYQLFSADSDYTGTFQDINLILSEKLADGTLVMSEQNANYFFLYRWVYAVVYALAPILTLGVVLTVFKSLAAKLVYRLRIFSDVYIFSELNERSLALANSIAANGSRALKDQYKNAQNTLNADYETRRKREIKTVEKEYRACLKNRENEILYAESMGIEPNLDKYPLPRIRTVSCVEPIKPADRSMIVFLGVEENNDEEIELAENARGIGALVFRTGVLTTNLKEGWFARFLLFIFKRKRNMNFFLIGENEAENVDTAIGLLAKVALRDHTRVFVFSDSPESELLLKSAGDETREKVRRKKEEKYEARYRKLSPARKQRVDARKQRKEDKKNAKKRKALEEKRALIEKDPTNFELYVEKGESDYRGGALVKRVNIIRSLIYHTLYNFVFRADLEEKHKENAQKLEAERTEEMTALLSDEISRHAFGEEDKALFVKLVSEMIMAYGEYHEEYREKLFEELKEHILKTTESDFCLDTMKALVKQYNDQKNLKRKDRVSFGELLKKYVIVGLREEDENKRLTKEQGTALLSVIGGFVKAHPYLSDETKSDFDSLADKFLEDKTDIPAAVKDAIYPLAKAFFTEYPLSDGGENGTLIEKLIALSKKRRAEDKSIKATVNSELENVLNIFERAVLVPGNSDNEDVFEDGTAAQNADKPKKVISAVVIGMGLHGTEMLKGLSWYGQMSGYELYINAYDRDKNARSRFAAQCPELMSAQYNGAGADGEDAYHIDIHHIDIDSEEFINHLKTLPTITYVAVCLGNDEKNLEMAVKMRSLCEKMGAHPMIQAIRYNLGENEDFSKAKNYRRQEYHIDLIGDMKSLYSVEAIIGSQYEYEALSRHMKWGGERSFWEFEYNYNSSIASAIHARAKKKLKIPGTEVDAEKRLVKYGDKKNFHVIDNLRRLEHRRWNAYMRSEGYTHGKRNDLAKTHHCLVPFDELSEGDKQKDDD